MIDFLPAFGSSAITHKQLRQLKHEVQQVGTGPAAEQAIFNRLRTQFHIRSIKELPAEQFDLALLLVRSLDGITREWRKLLNELDEAYIQDYLGGSVPWTPWVAREWRKRFKEALPPRPDWQAMQRQLGLKRKATPGLGGVKPLDPRREAWMQLKERGEIITRTLVLLESQGEFTGNDATLTGERLTDESRDEGEAPEDTLTVAELSTRLERIEAILSTITGESTDKSTGEAVSEAINAEPLEPEEAVALSETPSPPVALSTDTPTVTTLPEHPARLPPKRVAALIRRAKKLSAQGVSWKEIARRFNAEGVPTLSGIGHWYGSTVAKLCKE